MSGLPEINIKLATDLTDFLRGMDVAQRSMQKLGDEMQKVGKQLSLYLTAPLAAFGAASLKAAGDTESLKQGLQAVTEKGQSVNKVFKELEVIARAPGLNIKQAVQGYINLKAVGMEGEKAKAILGTFGNALALVGRGGEDLGAVVTQLVQMSSKSKVVAGDFKPIMERIPQLAEIVRREFGTIDTEVLQKMGVSTETMVNTMLSELGKLPKAAGGINNAFENMGDSLVRSSSTIGEVINKNFNITGIMDKIGAAVVRLSEAFAQLSPGVQSIIIGVTALAAAAGPLLIGLGFLTSNILPLLKTGITTVSALMTPLSGTILAIVGAVAALGYAARLIVDNWGLVKNFFYRLWNEILLGYANFNQKIADGINAFFEKLGMGAVLTGTGFKDMAAEAKKALDATPVVKFSDVMGGMVNTVKKDLKGLKDFFSGTGKEAEMMGKKIATALPGGNGGGGGAGSGGFDYKKLGSNQGLKQTEVKDPEVKADKADLKSENPVMLMDQATNGMMAFQEKVKNAMLSVKEAVMNTVVDVAAGFAEMAGSAMAGGEGFENLPKTIFSMFGNLLQQLGKIAMGVAAGVTGIRKALTSLNPVMAATAGVALIALGAMVKTQAANLGNAPKLARGGLAYAPTMAMVGDNVNARVDPEVVAPLSKLKSYMADAGGGGKVEVTGQFVVRGQDLIVVLDNAKQRQRGGA